MGHTSVGSLKLLQKAHRKQLNWDQNNHSVIITTQEWILPVSRIIVHMADMEDILQAF